MKYLTPSKPLAPLVAAAFLWQASGACAALTDIASAPMASSSSTVVKPNIMFILDDSGSMGWEYLPDSVNSNNSKNCYRNHLYNRIYYNPNVTYALPVDSTGASYPNATFTAAKRDGFDSSSTTTNLNTSFKAGNDGSGQQAYYYNYTGGGTPSEGTCYTDNKYTKVLVPSTSPEAQNFANWYSYYRTRILAMKTAAGRAFKNIDDKYRVGFSTISYTGTSSANSDFLKIADFDATQKGTWYAKLYGASANSSTPLRAALSKAGRIYAGKLLTGADDPVQYSCQQNFSILSTDGYWNTGNESSSYGPFQADGSTNVGNQDGTADRPLKDALNKSNTLADVAMYYYQTDLRSASLGNCTGALGTDVCENNVPGSGSDTASHQHMTTFTLGLGVNGTLAYTEDYESASSGDFFSIRQGTKNWPDPINNSGAERIDDLWHAAVNGRGIYYSAQNPDSLVSGISKALAGVSARTGSSAAAATSNLEPVAGDNFIYIALYRTVKWDGDLQAKTINPDTGELSATPLWSAQPLLDTKVSAASDTRTIHTFDSTALDKLKSFAWASLSATEQGYFNGMCSPTARLSQCTTLTTAQQTMASGQNLVNYLRGQDGYEDQAGNTDRIYRDREHVLGDMVNSQPVYVKQPPFGYVDANYDTFKNTTQKNRAATVYVAVNDGMLHAFDGDTGTERWAYVPPLVMPNLYKLADKNYATNHQYYVDGSPVVGDICSRAPAATCSGNEWKTILVGGLNSGGRGYYALDVTNPSSPKALWNFTVDNDADLGYTYGNPVITKRKDGTWVVVFTSGYNNVSPGDGKGYLYVLNANTGALLEKIGTNVGSTTTPSGLGKINAWINSTTDNTAERFYAGDLLGNVWRFDIDNTTPPAGKEALLLAELGQVSGAGIQPVTTKPELTEVTAGGVHYTVVSVGTGRYLGVSDLSDTSQQSVYSIKDSLTETGLGKVRLPGVLVEQTLTTFTSNGEQMRTSSTNAVDWSTQSGWYVDLNPNNESPGERVNVDMQQQLGLLTVAANVPNANACNLGGYAWLYYFDYRTGQYVPGSSNNMTGRRLGANALVAGIKTIKLTNGKTVTIVTDTGGGISGSSDPTSSGGSGGTARRVSWRELID
ncbi:MAG: PilC/PilY family type IV pilus protein [Pseudomonadota bacterium]|jgi:type IV pilus assembly protein PilY1